MLRCKTPWRMLADMADLKPVYLVTGLYVTTPNNAKNDGEGVEANLRTGASHAFGVSR